MRQTPGLAWATFSTASATELTDVAARLGCGSVALLGRAPGPGPTRPVGADEIATVRSTLAASGMILSSLDLLPITPDFDPAAHDAFLDLGARLGAQRIGAIVLDPDGDRAADNLRALAARARAYGLLVSIEFISFTPLRTLADAIALVGRIDNPAVSITFDSLHFARTGGRAAELTDATMAKIGYAQICDGAPEMAPDKLAWEAMSQRMVPGEGSFDLAGVFSKLPARLMIDIEVPMHDRGDRAGPLLERARLLVTATEAVLKRTKALSPYEATA